MSVNVAFVIIAVLIGIVLCIGFPICGSIISLPIVIARKGLSAIKGETYSLEAEVEEA